jgi:hypothetical protein
MSGTHTFATLPVSRQAYDEIAGRLRDVGYDHALHDGAIDMHGIGLEPEDGGVAGKPAALTPMQKLQALALRFYDGRKWEPARSRATERSDAAPPG